MSDHLCGCREYQSLSRRRFMQASAAGTAAAFTAPAWLPRISLAQSFRGGQRDVVVVIYLRGAADCLTMVAPYNDANYRAARPSLKLRDPDPLIDPDGTPQNRAIPLANGVTPGGTAFGFAPALAPLMPA